MLCVGRFIHGLMDHVPSKPLLFTSPPLTEMMYYVFPPVLLQNYFARNFYNMRMLALFVAFAINFILLFYKVKLCCETHDALSNRTNLTTFTVDIYCMYLLLQV